MINFIFINSFFPDNIFEFSPNQPLCLGEEVNLTCYLFPNTQTYNVFALISFNQTDPETVNNINTNRASIGYSATVAIPLMGSSARVQLTIASFKESDNNTLFGCHAELTSDASTTTAIASGYPPIDGEIIFNTMQAWTVYEFRTSDVHLLFEQQPIVVTYDQVLR